ncbi:MAG: DUF2608 domain-containing protein [Rickettsiaceae bacterium]|nr:DUF2608 domain-containing protein [Rickettsiaceae bacterium]
MKNKLKTILFFSIALIFSDIYAKPDITQIHSLQSKYLKKITDVIDKDTIVLITIDDNFVLPKAAMFNHKLHNNFITNLVRKAEKNPHYLTIVTNWYAQRKIKLVEDGWPEFIESLKEKGATVYGICVMPIALKNIEQHRLSELKQLGINFSEKINDKKVVDIKDVRGWKSMFYHGIIFTGRLNKIQPFIDLIKVTNIDPKKIVIFDNNRRDLTYMGKSMMVFNMWFYGVDYQAISKIKVKPDLNIVKFQQKQLIYQGKWYEDDVAKTMLLEKNK